MYLRRIENKLIYPDRFFAIIALIVFLLVILFFTENYPQSQKVSFRHLTINDGLSQNAVFTILQDYKGFMWFGTKDGLNRYDGYSFTVYQNDPFDLTTVSNNYILTLFEDSRNILWVGTLNGGLNYFDRVSESFIRIPLISQATGEIISGKVQAISEDSAGNIWVGTNGDGLLRLSISFENDKIVPGIITQFISDPMNSTSLSNNVVTSIMQDSKKVLWIGTEAGLSMYNQTNSSFQNFKILTKHPDAPGIPADNAVTSICEGREGDFWLGTLSGLVNFNRQNGKYKFYPHQYVVYRYGWGIIVEIIEDLSGKLWIATPAALMNFDPVTLQYEYFTNEPGNSKSLSFNSISSAYIDKAGVLWFGTAGMGISYYDPKLNQFATLTKKRDTSSRVTAFSVSSVLKDKNGFVWIGTGVLNRWNRKTGEIKSYEASSNLPESFGNVAIWSIIEAKNGFLWFATPEGLYRYDPLSGKTKQYSFDPSNSSGLKQRAVYTVFEDRKGTIWAVTDNFFSRITSLEDGIFESFRYNDNPPFKEVIRPVIFQDVNDNYWIGTKDGLMLFDPDMPSFRVFSNDPEDTSSINNNLVKSICADPEKPDKILWIGTGGGGLNRFDMVKKTFTHFTEESGLPNNVVYGILTDNNGYLWMSTNKGLSKFDPRTYTFRNYDVKDGLQSNEFNTGAYFNSNDGEMFFGGIYGLNYFFPEKIKDNPNIPAIVLTKLKIHDGYINTKDNPEILQKSISETSKITLSYEHDFIQIEFAALDFSAPEKNQYAYKLENFNKNWIYSGKVRTATFTNLSPGEYTFRVKGSNNDGLWNEEGLAVTIIITPPWWDTWWAYILYALLFLSGLYLIRRYELNRINLKNQLKLEKVESDTLRSLDHLKSQFFANISHEFRTPLTLILGQVESVMSSSIDTKEKGKLQVANRNARRLLTLINQLLDLSKLEAGSMELKAGSHNIVSFIKSLFYSFESLAASQKISLRFETESEFIPVVFDPDKLEKVFYNLISNAFKFTPANGEIKIIINQPLLQDTDKDFVEIKICDTGIGIQENKLDYIFNRFYQVDGSASREHEGSGIGLALTKELIDLHKGKISVLSKAGEGTVFIIHLPAGKLKTDKYFPSEFPDVGLDFQAADGELLPEGEQIPDMKPAASELKELILIVEDNPDVRAYIREQTENSYITIEASDGMKGILIAKNEIPDLIITDVMMPEMDGYQFLRLIKSNEKTSHIPVIMLTAKAGLDDKISGLETGADDYITKPFSAKELNTRIKNLIRQRKLLREKFSTATVIKPSEVTTVSVDQKFLQKILEIIEANYEDENFGVEILAEKVHMSGSQLNRKLNALVNQPPGQLIRSLRLQRAADLLKQNAGTVAEICYKVGFNDQAYFSRAFKKQFGYSPSEFKTLDSI